MVEKNGGEKKVVRTLTQAQKQLIRRRDGHQCQYPGEHNCNGDEQTLHVHHITPTRWMQERLQRPPAEADSPLNLTSVCEDIHIGGRRNAHPLHPDVPKARRSYAQGNRNSYNEMFDRRNEAMAQGEPYWDPTHDEQLRTRARKNTGKAIAKGEFDWDNAGKKRDRRAS